MVGQFFTFRIVGIVLALGPEMTCIREAICKKRVMLPINSLICSTPGKVVKYEQHFQHKIDVQISKGITIN